MNLNYEWYRTFYTVVKEGGFSKAADKLCVTQPAVSQAIRRLEECAGETPSGSGEVDGVWKHL